MCMFYIIVNIETSVNGWNVNMLVTTDGLLQRRVNKQASKQDVLMDGSECMIMGGSLPAHDFLDKRIVTVLLACVFRDDVSLILMYF